MQPKKHQLTPLNHRRHNPLAESLRRAQVERNAAEYDLQRASDAQRCAALDMEAISSNMERARNGISKEAQSRYSALSAQLVKAGSMFSLRASEVKRAAERLQAATVALEKHANPSFAAACARARAHYAATGSWIA